MKTYLSLTEPYYWVNVNKNGEVESDGQVGSLDEFTPPKSTRLYGVVPGHAVVIHQTKIPARNRNRVLAAIPYALEDQLATDVEDLFFAVLERDRSNQVRVAVVERTQMDAWIEAAKVLGRPLDGLVPAYLLLPSHPRAQFIVAITEDNQVYVRSKHFWGACLDQDSLGLWWRELNDENTALAVNDPDLARFLVSQGGNLISQWDIGQTFPEWLRFRANADDQEINLLQGAYAPEHSGRGNKYYKIAAALFIAAVLIRALFDAYEYLTLRAAAHQLDEAMVATFKKAFPGARIQQGVDLRADMGSRIQQMQTGTGAGEFQVLLSAIANAVRESPAGVTVQSIDYRKQELIVTCITDSFEKLNSFKRVLEGIDFIDPALTSSSSLENKVTGKFSIRAKS